jgi:predicted DNA-binding transcriptional regulator YafY
MTARKNKVNGAKPLPSEAKSPRPEVDRRLRQADRLARLLRMLQLLLSRGRWNARDIAAEQEVSERTVYRDREVLQLAGVPVDYEQEDKCYRVRQDFRFPALNVTEEEALGQATATAITTSPGLDIASGSRSVSQKLTASSREEIAQILADAEQLISVLDLKLADHSRHRDFIRAIQWALVKRKQLAGTYRSPYESAEVRLQLHPYRLCLVKAAWYLVGCPVGEDVPRTYRVTRFKTLRMTDANALVLGDFDLKAYFGNAWAVYRGERCYDVEILFSKEAAATVTETVWHHTQNVRKNKDGSVTLTFRVDGLNEILRWILGWGNRAVVIQPAELKQLVAEQFRSALRPYESETAVP